MFKELFTRNFNIKLLAFLLAVILWTIARFWQVK